MIIEKEIEIKLIDALSTRKLRYKELWPHLNSFEECLIEPDDEESTFHIGAEWGGKIVGTSTFIVDINKKFEETNQYRLRAMATDSEVRGRGVGVKLVENGINELKKRGIKLLWCDARIKAAGFYERMNFSVLGEIYNVPKIGPHKLMYKEI